MLKAGGQSFKGTVTHVGTYNFHLETEDGEVLNMHTEQGSTRFEPEGERLMVCDVISVVYFAPLRASLSVDKHHVLLIDFVKKLERKFMDGEGECLHSLPKYRNGGSCLIKETGQLVRYEGTLDLDPYLKPGDPIKIKLKAVPARVGNGYVYMAKKPW